MAARMLGRVGAALGRSSFSSRSLTSVCRTSFSPVQRQLFDKRSHARVQQAPYHASAAVFRKAYGAELSPAAARVPTVPGVHPNSGGYELPHNPPDRAPVSTAVYITASSVEDKPNEIFPDPGGNWYRTLNSLTGLKGIAYQNYLSGYFRHAFGYHRDAGYVGMPRGRSPYVWPAAFWGSIIIVTKELMVIDAEWLAVPFYWFTWWVIATFGQMAKPVIEGSWTKVTRSAARREKLTETMYTVKELIQTHHDFITFVRGLPGMVSELGDLVESQQTAQRNAKHHQIKQFVEGFLEFKLREQQAAQAARQSKFESEALDFVSQKLTSANVKNEILDSTIAIASGSKQHKNPVSAAFVDYLKYVRKNAAEEAKAAAAARPAIDRAIAKSRAARANRRHEIAQKIKAGGGPDLLALSPAVKADALTSAEEAIIASNREAGSDQREQWLIRLKSLIPSRTAAIQ